MMGGRRMTVKLLGSLLLIVTGVALAVMICRYHRQRLRTLDGILALLYYVKGQVDCYARPLRDILATLPAEVCRECNCPKGISSFEELIGECRIYLDQEAIRYLEAFAAEFGSTFREEQVKRCEHYASLLDANRRHLSERIGSESRVGSTISIFLALCLTILLW